MKSSLVYWINIIMISIKIIELYIFIFCPIQYGYWYLEYQHLTNTGLVI